MLKTAWKNTNGIMKALLIISISDLFIFELLKFIPEPVIGFAFLGQLFNKISYSYFASFIFFFITQKIKFAENKIKNEPKINKIKIDFINAYLSFINQLEKIAINGVYLTEEKINNLTIGEDELIMLFSGISAISIYNSEFNKLFELYCTTFEKRFIQYTNKLLEYKEYLESRDLIILENFLENEFTEFALNIDRMEYKITYMSTKIKLLIQIQTNLKNWKALTIAST